MYDFIPSQSVREYAEKTGRIFTDAEKATLIYHNFAWDIPTKQAHLQELARTTLNVSLKKQIRERLAYEKACLNLLYGRGNAGCVYKLTSQEDGFDGDPSNEIYFASCQMARQYAGMLDDEDPRVTYTHTIDKIRPTSPGDGNNGGEPWQTSSLVGSLTYKHGRLMGFQVFQLDKASYIKERWPDKGGRFEEDFIDIPNPFSKGDIVRILNPAHTEELIGVVFDGHEWLEEHRGWIPGFSWDEPMNIVDVMDKEAHFGHYHAMTSEIEFCQLPEGDPRKDVLECASYLLCGKTDIEGFQMVCEEFLGKKKENTAETTSREEVDPQTLLPGLIKLSNSDIATRMDNASLPPFMRTKKF